jgi:hypothetical protein
MVARPSDALRRRPEHRASISQVRDIKKLGRFSSVGHRVTGRRTGYCSSQGAGWEFVHVAIDDHSRIARAEIFPDQKKESAVAFLATTVAYFRSLGITVERVMTTMLAATSPKPSPRLSKK